MDEEQTDLQADEQELGSDSGSGEEEVDTSQEVSDDASTEFDDDGEAQDDLGGLSLDEYNKTVKREFTSVDDAKKHLQSLAIFVSS